MKDREKMYNEKVENYVEKIRKKGYSVYLRFTDPYYYVSVDVLDRYGKRKQFTTARRAWEYYR